MAVLAWLLIPLFAVVGAAIWGSWVQRNKTIGDVAELAGYARFRDAMERSHPTAASAASSSARAAAAPAHAERDPAAAPHAAPSSAPAAATSSPTA